MLQLVELTGSPIFQVAVVLLSATLVVASLALILASRKASSRRAPRHHDAEAGIEGCVVSLVGSVEDDDDDDDEDEEVDCGQQPVPARAPSSASSPRLGNSRRFITRVDTPVFLSPATTTPFNQQRLLEMLKSKRVRLSPELHCPRKFALVNHHIRNVFQEHRRYTQLPTFNQVAAAVPQTRPWSTAAPHCSSPVINRFAQQMTASPVPCA